MPSGINTRRPHTPDLHHTTPPTTSENNLHHVGSTFVPQTSEFTAIQPGEVTSAMTNSLGTAARPVATEEVLKTYFAPYDDMRKVELSLLDEVIAARKSDPKVYTEGENPYQIRYAVYNLSSRDVLEKLVEADRAGIAVQILIEDHQLQPEKHWNDADEFLRAKGFSFADDHTKLSLDERKSTQMIGIKNENLMHLKSRIVTYPDPETGQPVKKLLTGSMNPGESATSNDENLSLITDTRVVDRYLQMYEAIRDEGKITNKFDPNEAINPMFTGAPISGGPRVADQIFKWIDQEKEAIFLTVFSLRDITTPSERTSLVKKLQAAKERGVEVVVITDKKQADGVDAYGKQVFYDDPTDEKLRAAGIPVYEALNTSGPFNAMHAKAAVFGLTDMKVITDTGNWTKAALGSHRPSPVDQNEESYLFVDSQKLDNNLTGRRYLGNFLHLLRTYAPQNPQEASAEDVINRISQHPSWPKVSVDFSVMAHTFMGQDVYVTGNHPALGNWTQDGPGLKLNTSPGRYPFWESGGSLELPFGTQFSYKIVKRNSDGSLDWQPGKNSFLIVDPTDQRFTQPDHNPTQMTRTDKF